MHHENTQAHKSLYNKRNAFFEPIHGASPARFLRKALTLPHLSESDAPKNLSAVKAPRKSYVKNKSRDFAPEPLFLIIEKLVL